MDKLKFITVIGVILLTGMLVSQAQDSVVTVPDLTGLSVPAAAAQLNAVGLAQGREIVELWADGDPRTPGLITNQAVAAGSSLAGGSRVDVTVLRLPNTTLIYDDNDLTVVNRSATMLDLSSVTFSTVDGTPGSFLAGEWAGTLRPFQCVQVWSVGRNGPKGLDECFAIQNWLITRNPQEHFWTGREGTTQFTVSQHGVQQAVCSIGGVARCDFYLDELGNSGEITSFVRFSYTQDWLVIHNTSDDQWMLLDDFTLYNNFGGAAGLPIPMGDSSLYGEVNPVAQVNQLAPGQCLRFLHTAPTGTGPAAPDCLVAGQLTVDANIRFWGGAFEFISLSDQRRRSCPAETRDRVTVCIMPR
jgi:hypothetical protein